MDHHHHHHNSHVIGKEDSVVSMPEPQAHFYNNQTQPPPPPPPPLDSIKNDGHHHTGDSLGNGLPAHGHEHHGSEGHEHHTHESHAMYLNWNTSIDNIFFSFWTANTPERFWISIMLIFFLSVAYESYIYYRSLLEATFNKNLSPYSSSYEPSVKKRLLYHIAIATTYALQCFYAYFLMMTFMTFNGFIVIAIISGFFTGRLVVSILKPGYEVLKPETPCH